METVEIESLAEFDQVRAASASLRGLLVQSVDLTGRDEALLSSIPLGAIFLGCALTPRVEEHLLRHGALVFPRLPDLGFGRGHRLLRVTLIWCIVPVLAIIYLLFSGALLSWVGQMLLSNSLNNGFFEEFLFRGALQTRLRRLMSPAWALVLQAVLFGVWHVGLGYGNYGEPGGVISALASTIAFQAVLGLAFGYIFERSRNLFAPSVFHVLYNTMFSL